MKAIVIVTLKKEVLDPQGAAIHKACGSLGYDAITSVRQGKLFEIELDAANEEQARAQLTELADKLLANTVIEDFRVERIEA